MFGFSNCSNKSIYYDNSSTLVIGKMKDETVGIAIEEFVGIKQKMYSYLVDDNIKHKRAKDVNKNVVSPIIPNEYKDALLNEKCLRYWINRIQCKDHRTGTYEINRIFLSCLDDKIYIQKNECDGLAYGY